MEETTAREQKSEALLVGNIKIFKKISQHKEVMCCSILPKQNLVAIGWSDGNIEVRDTKSGNLLHDLVISDDNKGVPVASISSYDPSASDPLLLASYASGHTRLWNCAGKKCLWSVREDRQTLTNAFNTDYTWFAASGSDAKIHIYDMNRQQLVNILQRSEDPDVMDGHTKRVFCVRFHPSNPHEIVSGGWDNTVQMWDVREALSKRKIRGPHICGEGIEFMNENEILTASWTKKNFLQLWDYRNCGLIENIVPDNYTSFLYCCQYVPSGPFILVGGGNENMFRVIDTTTFITSASYRHLSGAVYFAKELPGNQMNDLSQNVCVGFDQNVYFMEVSV